MPGTGRSSAVLLLALGVALCAFVPGADAQCDDIICATARSASRGAGSRLLRGAAAADRAVAMPLNTAVPHNAITMAAPGGADVSSWKVTTKHGTQSGVGVSVSGAGAWAQMEGTMTFHILHLDESKTYQYMKKTYGIGGGIGGFFSWLGLGANAETHKTEIHSVFNEIKNQQKVKGTVAVKLSVTGLYPNVEVDATAYVTVMQVTDSSGNTFTVASNGDPAGDTGAQDSTGQSLPTKDNASTIKL